MKLFCRVVIELIAALSILTAALAYAHEGHSHSAGPLFTKHFQASLFDISEKAKYSIEVLLDDREYNIGKDVIGIVVHDADDNDVVGAELLMTLKDTGTGEVVTGTPAVTDKKNGLYIVSGLNLMRQGKSELVINIKKSGVEDKVKFALPDSLKDRPKKGRYYP